MATASEGAKKSKNVAAAERVRTATIGAGEPIITMDNYNVDMANAFSYYHTYEDDKVKRKWVQKYLGKDKDSLSKLNEVPDHDLKQVAVLIRLTERGQPLRPEHADQINSRLNKSLGAVDAVSTSTLMPNKSTVPVISVSQRVDNIATGFISDIEHELDQFILNKKTDFSMKDYVTSKSINGPSAKIIAKWFTRTLNELNETIEGSDEQLVESYAFLKPSELKKFRGLVQNIVDECVQQKMKVVRKTRKVKIKPASEVVKRVKYLPEFVDETLTLKSEHPVKLVNSNECWLYNAKTRRMTLLKAVDKDILVVKGTSIVNFDTIKSETRTLRKPEEFFKTKLAKRDLNAAWKALTTKSVPAKGRIGEETIIVAIFN